MPLGRRGGARAEPAGGKSFAFALWERVRESWPRLALLIAEMRTQLTGDGVHALIKLLARRDAGELIECPPQLLPLFQRDSGELLTVLTEAPDGGPDQELLGQLVSRQQPHELLGQTPALAGSWGIVAGAAAQRVHQLPCAIVIALQRRVQIRNSHLAPDRSRCGTTVNSGSSAEAIPASKIPKRVIAEPASSSEPASTFRPRRRRLTAATADPTGVSASATFSYWPAWPSW